MGKGYPWSFWQVRDTRTIFDLGINPDRPDVLAHHALHDAYNQAIGVQNVFRKLRTSSTLEGQLLSPLKDSR
jgi:hypothetical protein